MTRGPRAGTKRVTLVDVAAAAGVDKAIVSRVVNRDPTLLIRPETRVRVEAAIAELGYRPNLSARSLRTAKTGILGLVIPDFSNPVYAQIIAGAETAAVSSGNVLVTGSATGAASPAAYLDLLGNGRVDGLLIAGGAPSTQEQRILDSLDIPWLLVNRRDRKSRRYVILDDAKSARMAVEHLVELGHTEIAHIAGPKTTDTAQRRLTGFTEAMSEHGLRTPASRIVVGEYTMDGGAEAAAKLMSSRRRPTAIYVANVAAAVGVLHQLSALGLSVPGDVSVVTTHDTELASHVMPALTTVRMPLRELGARAVRSLLDTPPDAQVELLLADDFTLVQRESTAPL
ncbi:LacI family transcriptional regulator [Asanoa hainanensis]|uniref:LacI family transcriptional regulator n=1 Tax=Asanoa hainanensis TaxID=560556 RepID=A0A239N5V1_9ACTN|nr:LacI family DNA-binding transcriptional regulator [Asanoa hainanensis]SNT50286.1 LacI family transcriptional regulator [Asanoa hainanensis]